MLDEQTSLLSDVLHVLLGSIRFQLSQGWLSCRRRASNSNSLRCRPRSKASPGDAYPTPYRTYGVTQKAVAASIAALAIVVAVATLRGTTLAVSGCEGTAGSCEWDERI